MLDHLLDHLVDAKLDRVDRSALRPRTLYRISESQHMVCNRTRKRANYFNGTDMRSVVSYDERINSIRGDVRMTTAE
jgi:hypothetical protein